MITFDSIETEKCHNREKKKSYDGKTKWIKVWISCQKNTMIFEKCL